MLLNHTAEYALRAMAVLAELEPGENLPARDLAERTGIPQHYLSKIMRRLVVAGLVAGRKGHGGGFALGRPARRITFAEILEASEFDLTPDRCAFGLGSCDPGSPCTLHGAWSRLNEAFLEWARGTTLAEGRGRGIDARNGRSRTG